MLSTKCNCSKVMSGVRCLSTSFMMAASHYDVLEISSKSTLSDIKTAYYRLSKIYHPDVNNEEYAAKKFRAITEAYEILGNIRTKNLYDRGVIGRFDDNIPEDESPDIPTAKFHKSRQVRTRVPTDGKTPIYDFDAWSHAHYGQALRNVQYRKAKKAMRASKQDIIRNSMMLEVLTVCILLSGVTIGYATMISSDDSFKFKQDRNTESKD